MADSSNPAGEVPDMDLNRDEPTDVPVLIVGGGPIGLCTSLLLSYHGIRSLLVEQHPGTSIYPKARMIHARTMEIFRQLGLEQAIRDVAIPHTRYLIYAHSLAGEELLRRPLEKVMPEPVRDWSPTWGCTSTQELFEPVLLEQARRRKHAQTRFSTQFACLEQSDEAVIATLIHRPSGRVQRVRARYLIGTDGSHSSVREALGIRMTGQPILSHSVDILFRADLTRWVGDREINICTITNLAAPGLLLYNGDDHWRFTAFYYPHQGQCPEEFTAERSARLVRLAVGVPELPLELDSITPWNDAVLVADRFYDGRVFLVGDATHQMSPAGGFGMNVGIQEAHNLAWKIAAVLQGWAPPRLLASYEAERAPISRLMTEQMARNISSVRATLGDGVRVAPARPVSGPRWGRPESGREHGLVFGATYDSAVIVPHGTSPVQVANPVTDYVPNARPGSRAPHVWLERDGRQISTLDLFGSGLVVLTGALGREWGAAAREVAKKDGKPLVAYTVGAEGDLKCADEHWRATCGIDDDGAVLVRPDGFVSWRSGSYNSDPTQEMKCAIDVAVSGSDPPRTPPC
jgi:putative polyketide hydroxylase